MFTCFSFISGLFDSHGIQDFTSLKRRRRSNRITFVFPPADLRRSKSQAAHCDAAERRERGSWLWQLGPKRVSEARKGEEDVRTSFICVQFRFSRVVDTLEKRKTATDLISSSSHCGFFSKFSDLFYNFSPFFWHIPSSITFLSEKQLL